jgi:hypothetical protein
MLKHKHVGDAETISLEPLKSGMDINRTEGTTYLRIWTPREDKQEKVFEGSCIVARLRHKKVKLRDIPGHGGELHVLSSGERHNLGVTCIERGCVRTFLPAILGNSAQLAFLSEKDPAEAKDNGYILFQWLMAGNYKAKFCRIPSTSILPNSTERVWRFRDLSSPMAVALTWKGSWLGADWNLDLIRNYVERRTDLPEHDFAILKWLRVPVLHNSLASTFKKAVAHAPSRFIRSWLNDYGMPEGVLKHDHILGLDSVARHFFWNEIPRGHIKEVISVVGLCDGGHFDEERCCMHLGMLVDISPVLLWQGLDHCRMRCANKLRCLLNLFTRNQLDLPQEVSNEKMRFRLQYLEKRILDATGICEERLKELVINRLRSLAEPRLGLLDQNCDDLLRLGETHSGRKFLAVRIGLCWLDQVRL